MTRVPVSSKLRFSSSPNQLEWARDSTYTVSRGVKTQRNHWPDERNRDTAAWLLRTSRHSSKWQKNYNHWHWNRQEAHVPLNKFVYDINSSTKKPFSHFERYLVEPNIQVTHGEHAAEVTWMMGPYWKPPLNLKGRRERLLNLLGEARDSRKGVHWQANGINIYLGRRLGVT